MRTLPAPWKNHRQLGTHRFEMTPFHFKGELYLLENFCDYKPEDFAPDEYPPHTAQDGFIIRRVCDDAVIGEVVRGNYFASALTVGGKVYAFASLIEDGQTLHRIVRYETEDLVNWSGPEVVFEAEPDCMIFNTSIVWNGEKFIGVYETDTPENLRKYIFKFWESEDLKNFRTIENAVYGLDKYVGANVLYYAGGYYYLLFLGDRLDGTYETQIARSGDLVNWEDSDIPVMIPDLTHEINPACPGRMELNASDVEMIEDKGRTVMFWAGGDQHGCCDMQCAEYDGPMNKLLESYFN